MASERILLVQLADIGDLVLTTPAIAALRDAKPGAQIDVFASERALPLLPEGLVDQRHPFARADESASRAFFRPANLSRLAKLRRCRYDTVVFFHHFTVRVGVFKFWLIAKACGVRRILGLKNDNINFLTDSVLDEGFGVKHQAQYWLDLVGLLGASSAARPAQVRRERFASRSPAPAIASGRRPVAVLHIGSGAFSPARRWSSAQFAAVARNLQARLDAEIMLVGAREDAALLSDAWNNVAFQDLLGRTSLPQLADVIGRADLFIGADSGVMHIAAATGTPVISIFGPSNADAWRPWAIGSPATVLRSGVACSPCSYVGHGIGNRLGCPARTCMKLVSTDAVLEAAESRLSGRGWPTFNSSPTPGGRVDVSSKGRLTVLGVPVDAVTYGSWLAQIDNWISGKTGAKQVCTVNPEFIMIAQRDAIFFHILNRAAICVPDGVGLLWASRLLGSRLPQRVTGSDGVPLIARYAAERGWRVFFLGAAEGIAGRAADILKQRHPALIVAGVYAGSPAGDEEDAIVARVNASDADILFVAYGAPGQDKWIARNLPRLDVAMAMGVGGSLDFIAGAVPRAPRWMQDLGLEWLFRLLRQPWRARRMFRLPRFVFAVLRQRRTGISSRRPGAASHL